MKVAIAGGTGLIGSKLIELLQKRGDEIIVLTRNASKINNGVKYVQWLQKDSNLTEELEGIDVFINLAGESLNGGRWTEAFKKKIYNSRIQAANEAFRLLQSLSARPTVYISASAVGIYPPSHAEVYTETSQKVSLNFLGVTVKDWEQHAKAFNELEMRTCYARFGVILDKNSGALPKMILPYKFFVGGTVGSGQQWLSWIHIEDAARAVLHMIDTNSLEGPVNVTSPNVERMEQFGKILSEVIDKPHWLKVPSFALKLALGEQSQLVLEGQCVIPEKLLNSGFYFKFPSLKEALTDLLKN